MPALPVPRGGGSSSAARPVDSAKRRQRPAPSRCSSAASSTDPDSSWFDRLSSAARPSRVRYIGTWTSRSTSTARVADLRDPRDRQAHAGSGSVDRGWYGGVLPQRLCLPADGGDRKAHQRRRPVGIHRPSLRAPPEGGPRQASEDAIVAALSEQLVLYAQQMHVPRTIIDALMVVPPDRVELLSASALATCGIKRVDAVALEERRTRSQSLLHPGTAQGR